MAKKHVHMYHKIQKKYGAGVWACALSNCTHYLPHNVSDMIYGRESLCTNCMEMMVLDEIKLKNDEPICANCANAQEGILIEKSFDPDEYMEELKKKKYTPPVVENKIEVDNGEHAPDCEAWEGGDCTCQ